MYSYWGKRRTSKMITRFLHFSGFFSYSQFMFSLVYVPKKTIEDCVCQMSKLDVT